MEYSLKEGKFRINAIKYFYAYDRFIEHKLRNRRRNMKLNVDLTTFISSILANQIFELTNIRRYFWTMTYIKTNDIFQFTYIIDLTATT